MILKRNDYHFNGLVSGLVNIFDLMVNYAVFYHV